jgi:hypothetical protein
VVSGGRRLLRGGIVAAVTLASCLSGAAGAEPTPARVTLLGDSVATALAHDEAYAVLTRGVELRVDDAHGRGVNRPAVLRVGGA